MLRLALTLLGLHVATAACPYRGAGSSAYLGADTLISASRHRELLDVNADVDWDSLRKDLTKLMTDSQDFWPADQGVDAMAPGRGLIPRYGHNLSWGDLIILAGNTAIESMGLPTLGFCGGRTDDVDGSASVPLGPNVEQELLMPCPVNGNCTAPLGPTTVGLIYVNPEGPMGKPDLMGSYPQTRDSFGRMGMNDSETVALIGGGHAFGKVHGACPTGPGPAPNEDPFNAWPGTCGTGDMKGKGLNTFTSGFEGSWTTQPTKWTNEYFKNLLAYDWEVHVGPGGHNQWRPVQKSGGPPVVPIMMLTSDVSLLKDPQYLEIIKLYASDITALETSFTHAWYKLQTRDMGPVTRCMGKSVPPAQPFQYPLPPTPSKLADFDKVRDDIKAAITTVDPALTPDYVGTQAYYGALFATLAWRCAATFRVTDYAGGCNGARIRLSPQKDWPINKGMDKVLDVLKAIKQKYDSSNDGALSWADLIVLAGQTAVEEATGEKLKFCGGRVDSEDGGSEALAPREYYPDPILDIKDSAQVMGLTTREYTALSAQLRSPSQQARLGYNATTWTDTPDKISNSYFITLLTETWSETPASTSSPKEYVNSKGLHMMPTDVAIKFDPESLAVAQEYAIDNGMFVAEFIAAWTRVMNADRFDGPYKNLCTDKLYHV